MYALPSFARQGATAFAPGLERIEALMRVMGDPHLAYPVVHIAGTNGKGSTASFLASIAFSLGKKVGLHTSPHLFHPAERLRVNGKPAPEAWLAEQVSVFKKDFDRIGVSFFEATVALSLLYFFHETVDLAVVEVGLGGRLDATNIVKPDLTIITSIGLDHTDILGETLEEIAAEKAGIVKTGIPLVSGVEQPQADAVIRAIAYRQNALFHSVGDETSWHPPVEVHQRLRTAQTPLRDYPELRPGLSGRHQYKNAMLALRGAELCYPEATSDVESVAKGLAEVVEYSGLRGRVEVCREEPIVVLDVGHNPDGLREALAFMSKALHAKDGHLFVAFGCMQDKDVKTMSGMLAEARAHVLILPVSSARAMNPVELSLILKCDGVAHEIVQDAHQALDLFYKKANPEDGLLVTGSHLVVAQFPDLMSR